MIAVLADVVDWLVVAAVPVVMEDWMVVLVAVVPVEVAVVLADMMVAVLDVPPVLDDVLPLWAVLVSVVADAAVVGVWLMVTAVIPEVLEAETWFVAALPEEVVVVAPADIEAAVAVTVLVWPDTNTAVKRIPNKRRSRAAVRPVLQERRTNFASYFMVPAPF